MTQNASSAPLEGQATADNQAAPTRCNALPARCVGRTLYRPLRRLEGAEKARVRLECPALPSTMDSQATLLTWEEESIKLTKDQTKHQTLWSDTITSITGQKRCSTKCLWSPSTKNQLGGYWGRGWTSSPTTRQSSSIPRKSFYKGQCQVQEHREDLGINTSCWATFVFKHIVRRVKVGCSPKRTPPHFYLSLLLFLNYVVIFLFDSFTNPSGALGFVLWCPLGISSYGSQERHWDSSFDVPRDL